MHILYLQHIFLSHFEDMLAISERNDASHSFSQSFKIWFQVASECSHYSLKIGVSRYIYKSILRFFMHFHARKTVNKCRWTQIMRTILQQSSSMMLPESVKKYFNLHSSLNVRHSLSIFLFTTTHTCFALMKYTENSTIDLSVCSVNARQVATYSRFNSGSNVVSHQDEWCYRKDVSYGVTY